MTWILIILMAFAVWHLLYESVIAPSLRMSLRYEVFRLRDDLRRLKFEDARLTKEVYGYMEDALNNSLAYLHGLTISSFGSVSRGIERDQSLRKDVEKRRHAIDSCPIPEVPRIDEELGRILRLALGVNSGGWFLWILPVALALRFWRWVLSRIQWLLLVPPRYTSRLAGVDGNPATT